MPWRATPGWPTCCRGSPRRGVPTAASWPCPDRTLEGSRSSGPVYEKYCDGYFVSISNSDRAPGLNYLATVYNGIDLSLYPLQELGGDHLIFLGRIHPDKGVNRAIEVARLSGLPLLIAGIIQDRTYFREQ